MCKKKQMKISFHLELCLERLALWPVGIFSLVSTSQKAPGPACILVASWIDWGSSHDITSSNLCPVVPALRVIFHKGSWTIKGLCCLSLHCLLGLEKSQTVVLVQGHRLVGLWLEASHILRRNQRHHFHYTILTTCKSKVFSFLE